METTDYKAFKTNVPQPGDRLDRIENVMVTGMPDVNYCFGGVEGWIEQKSPKEPKRPDTPLFGSNHKMSMDQRNWFLRQRRAGGRAYILIVTDKRWMLLPGALADFINFWSVNELVDNAVWSCIKPIKDKQQWVYLREALMR